MKRTFMDQSDYEIIAGNFTTIQTFINGSTDAVNNLLGRVTSLETSSSSIAGLLTRMSSAESTIGSHTSSMASLVSRAAALETWRGAKASASANISTSYNLPTVAIVGLLSTVTKAGVEAALSGLASEINAIKQIMRDREMMAA